MAYRGPAFVPACPPLQLARQSYGQVSFRSRGDGEAVVFLHGLLGSSKSWAFQFERLSRNHRVPQAGRPVGSIASRPFSPGAYRGTATHSF